MENHSTLIQILETSSKAFCLFWNANILFQSFYAQRQQKSWHKAGAHQSKSRESTKNLALIKDNRDNAKEQHVFYTTLVEKH